MSAQPDRRAPQPGSRHGCRARNKETRRLIKEIEAAGGEVEPSRNRDGHWKVYLNGAYIGGLASTPSDHRSTQNDIARLRRGGLKITTKGRYEGP